MFPWCTALRGWRIQWSIVPEVSEPVVRNLSSHLQCFTLAFYIWITNCAFNIRCSEWLMIDRWLTNGSVHDISGSSVLQEPPKEDLTVSEKFQLVLDVAQKAQVRRDWQSEAPHHSRCLRTGFTSAVFVCLFRPHRIFLGRWRTSWRKLRSEFVCTQFRSSQR